jgi:MoaA/NifB/PqqE/SkfB family radical SAM enzyme
MENVLNRHAYPQWITLQLMDACNLRCKMCYEWGDNGAYHGGRSTHLNLDILKKLVNDCKPAKPYYALFGGEPMMYPKLGELVRTIRAAGSRVDSPTNGMYLAKRAEELCENPLNRIWVSLDGPKEINDAQRGAGVFDAVQEGMRVLFDLRETKALKEPELGYTFIVTPLTYRYIQTFVAECVNLKMIDHLSIEFQTFVTEHTYEEHRNFFRRMFGVSETPYARGMVADIRLFAEIDYAELARQIQWVKEQCLAHDVYFINYPKTISDENYRAYFNKDIPTMADKRDRCMFPWMYLEIAANGDATTCHTFYDYPIGNVNELPVLDIWRGEPVRRMRTVLRQHGLYPICTACARYYADSSRH